MSTRPLVTVVGATGAQGGSVVRALLKTNKYKVKLVYAKYARKYMIIFYFEDSRIDT